MEWFNILEFLTVHSSHIPITSPFNAHLYTNMVNWSSRRKNTADDFQLKMVRSKGRPRARILSFDANERPLNYPLSAW